MSDEKQETLEERVRRVREEIGEQPAPGHEFTADGYEARTPSRKEFFENLEKAAKPEK